MSDNEFGKDEWVGLFKQIGLDEARMHQWHAAFEKQWPEAHRSFLEWLRIPATDVDRIREASRGPWA